jgi:hypothetical protein
MGIEEMTGAIFISQYSSANLCRSGLGFGQYVVKGKRDPTLK